MTDDRLWRQCIYRCKLYTLHISWFDGATLTFEFKELDKAKTALHSLMSSEPASNKATVRLEDGTEAVIVRTDIRFAQIVAQDN